MPRKFDFMNRKKALELLKEVGCSKEVINHSILVSEYSNELALKIDGVDLEFLEIAALLHDIGRARTHSILHGIAGAEILREHGFDERYQRVCERHIGAGISSKEAKELGLPERNYFPETLEEKIIAQADNLIDSRKRKSFKKVYKDFQKKFGKDSEIVMRFLKLQEELERLMR